MINLLGVLLLASQHFCYAKDVFAHFMAQNSYSYSASDWENDITTAQGIGIDGFALNTAANDYEVDRINDAYPVAESKGFKFFYSFDMSYNWSVDDMVNIVATHANSSATYTYNGDVLVSTYSGSAQGNDFWNGFKSSLASKGVTVKLAPAFTDYRDPSMTDQLLSSFPSIDGFFNWWSWPADVPQNLTTDTDIAYKNAIASRGGPYIMSVSPWQFKNLGGNNDWVEQSDFLWYYRWLQAIQDVNPDIVEIVTWNDYAESHYIGDINSNVDLGDVAPQYVDGFIHAPWRIVAQHFIQWYKNGSEPSVLNDSVVFWYRTHPKGAICSSGTSPRNADYPADIIIATALLIEAAAITLDIGSNHVEFQAGPGITASSIPFPSQDSQIPYLQIIRNNQTVKSGHGTNPIPISNSCSYYNFNPWQPGAGSTLHVFLVSGERIGHAGDPSMGKVETYAIIPAANVMQTQTLGLC